MSKLKIILIVVLLIAIILLLVFWFLSRKSEKETVILPDVSNQDQNYIEPQPEPAAPVVVPQISEEEKLKAQLSKLAAAFAERFGSYSNQSDFENLEDLTSFMSVSFKNWAENYVAVNRSQANSAAIYYGITTKALNTQVVAFTPESGQIKFKVACQRQEVIGSSANANVYYQDINIELIKEGGVWKVSRADWQ